MTATTPRRRRARRPKLSPAEATLRAQLLDLGRGLQRQFTRLSKAPSGADLDAADARVAAAQELLWRARDMLGADR